MLKIRLRKNKKGFFEPVEIYQDQEIEPQNISPFIKRRTQKSCGKEKNKFKAKTCGKGKKVVKIQMQCYHQSKATYNLAQKKMILMIHYSTQFLSPHPYTSYLKKTAINNMFYNGTQHFFVGSLHKPSPGKVDCPRQENHFNVKTLYQQGLKTDSRNKHTLLLIYVIS